ncbi:MAG: hypothetical protein L0211_16035, partial [Planctomycetaceae bacterium]|nr:hypothetical protein [Planctomycetaceae bacterium]
AEPAPAAVSPPAVFPAINASRPPLTPARASRKGLPSWLIATIGAVAAGALALVAVVAAVNWNSAGNTQPSTQPSDTAVAQLPPAPEAPAPEAATDSPAKTPVDGNPAPPAAAQPETQTPKPAEPPAVSQSPVPVESATAAVPAPEATSAAPTLPPIEPAVGVTTELLPLLNTRKTTAKGNWYFDGRMLGVTHGENSVIELPFAPPAEYDLHLEMRQELDRATGGIVLPVGPSSVLLAFDHVLPEGKVASGLSYVDGKWCVDYLPPSTAKVLPVGQLASLTVRVRSASDGGLRTGRVRVERAGEVVVDWAGDFSHCTLPEGAQGADPRRLAVYAYLPGCWFARVGVTPVGTSPEAIVSTVRKTSVPTEADQAAVREKLNDITSAAPKRTAADKLKLATELFKLAKDAQDSPAERYVLLRETQRWAAEAGEPRLALDATDLLSAEYELDSAAEVLKVASALVAAAKDDAAIGAVLEAVLPLAQQATAAQQFDAAQRMLEGLVRLVQRPAGRKYAAQVAELRTANTEAAKAARRLDAAREKLKSDPSDAAANLVLGGFLCFDSDDWTAGLAHLARSGDASLQACAAKELPSPPTSAEDQAALGDLWWDAAQKIAKEFRPGALSRAAHWYQRAQPEAAGLVKVKIEKRLEEITLAGAAVRIKPGRAGRILVVTDSGDERNRARAACQRFGLAMDEINVFDKNRTDYSMYATIICGSNAMDYWGREEARDPAHFQHVERFVNEGGHLLVCGSFNGRNNENLARFGFYTGFRHAETFASVGKATDLLFQGVEELVPQSGHMKSFGDILCTVPNDVLLRVGEGRREGEPALITLRHKKGRVTFTECEPHAEGDLWLIDVLLSWVARGCPVPDTTP